MPDPSPPPSIYPYDPSKVLPIFFAAIISITGLSLLHQSYRHKWIHFGLFTTWASLVWLTGFIIREISAFDNSNVDLYIAQYVFVFVGPPLYAASEYFILGRLLAYLPYHTPIHPGRVLTTFLLLSAAVESLSASGAASSASASTNPGAYTTSIAQIKASLILQEVVEGCFFGLVALVEYRCRRAGRFPRNVRTMCRMLYVTSIMMTIRCLVRIIQAFEATDCDPYAPGYKGYCGPVEHYEWYLWVFEVANITVFAALLAVFHPGRYLPADYKRYLDPADGETERIGPGYSDVDNRPWLVTVLDPFDWWGMYKGNGKETTKFWDRENPIAEGSFAAAKGNKTAWEMLTSW